MPKPASHRGCVLRESTPAIAEHTHTRSFQYGRLPQQREALLLDAEKVARLGPLDYFFDSVLRPVAPKLVDRVLHKLQSSDKPVIVDHRWVDFPVDPSRSPESEADTFLPLVNIVKEITSASKRKGKQPILHYKSNPHAIPESTYRDNSSRPDGYLIRRSHSSRWTNITAIGEFKKKKSRECIRDNYCKIVWSLHHCMSDDSRRRFVFGFTIEDTIMRLWFCARGVLLITEEFNFIEDHDPVVRFFLSMLYAKEQQLGWDTTMIPVGRFELDIKVRAASGEQHTYRTDRRVSDYGADSLLGGGTRIWVARRVVKGRPYGEPVTVKDIWVDGNRCREGDILDAIRDAQPSEAARQSFKTFFLQVECHGDVFIANDEDQMVSDNTLELIMRGQDIPDDAPLFDLLRSPLLEPAKPHSISHIRTSTGHHLTLDKDENSLRKILKPNAKSHYRIVFNRSYQPLHELSSLGSIFSAAGDIFTALKSMHKAGWVHRNLNTGTIVIGTDGRAKLTGLEYAKRVNDMNEPHTVRTAVADFMAVEVTEQAYQCHFTDTMALPAPAEDDPDADYNLALNVQNHCDVQVGKKHQLVLQIESGLAHLFRENPLHDLESLWWIVNYFLFERKLLAWQDNGDLEVRRALQQSISARELFSTRTKAFFRDTFKEHLVYLHPSVKVAGEVMENWRSLLVGAYLQVEQDPASITHTAADGLHGIFLRNAFETARDLSKRNVVIHAAVIQETEDETDKDEVEMQEENELLDDDGNDEKKDEVRQPGEDCFRILANKKRGRPLESIYEGVPLDTTSPPLMKRLRPLVDKCQALNGEKPGLGVRFRTTARRPRL